LLIFLARSALSEFSLSSLPVVSGFLYTLLGLARNLQYWWWIRKQILQNFGVPNAFLKDFFSFLPICVLYFISWLRFSFKVVFTNLCKCWSVVDTFCFSFLRPVETFTVKCNCFSICDSTSVAL
jgi:hypothetical protein